MWNTGGHDRGARERNRWSRGRIVGVVLGLQQVEAMKMLAQTNPFLTTRDLRDVRVFELRDLIYDNNELFDLVLIGPPFDSYGFPKRLCLFFRSSLFPLT